MSFATPDTAMLEALVPGYTLISRFFLSYFHIDLTAYLQYVVAMAVFTVSLRYISKYASEFFQEYFVSYAEIRPDDELFNQIMWWMSRQPFMQRTNHFVASVRANVYYCESEDEDDGSDEDSEDDDFDTDDYTDDEKEHRSSNIVSRKKCKPLRFTPSEGRHFFWYKGRLMILERQQRTRTGAWSLFNERLFLSCIGRNSSLIKELVDEASKGFQNRDGNKTIIYRAQRHSRSDPFDWVRCLARSPRPLSTVILDESQKLNLVKDMKRYLRSRTRRWHSNRGIAYKRGYLLHGPPGTGKTSLCFAAAGELGLPLYLLTLNSNSLDEDNLYTLFADLPRKCIVLIEDVDTAGITHSRGKTVTNNPNGSDNAVQGTEETSAEDKSPGDKPPLDKSVKDGITLSSLLNVIDGVASSEGRILVMTTNHVDRLDEALIRVGRVDMQVFLGYSTQENIKNLFVSIYMPMEGDLPMNDKAELRANWGNGQTTEKRRAKIEWRKKKIQEYRDHVESLRSRIHPLATEFASIVPGGIFTAAEIQGYLLNHIDDPEMAIKGAKEWAEEVQESKRARQEKTN
jgi:chaperone BCS1